MRFLFITKDFPNPCNLAHAPYNYNLASALAVEHQVDVVAPVSWIGKAALRGPTNAPEISQQSHSDALRIFHPTYYYPPRMLSPQRGWFYWQSVRSTVMRLCKSHPPDAVISYWIHPDGDAAVRAATIAGVPSVVIVGGSDLLLLTKQPGHRRRILAVLNRADLVLTVSEDLRQHAIDFGIDPHKVRVWHQGVDLDRYTPGDATIARRKLGLASNKKLVLWVGRMVPVKALDVLIDAIVLLQKRVENFHLCLVGDGPSRADIEAKAIAAGLSDCVRFAGTQGQDRLPDWYRAADVMVLPSYSEGLPNVLREASACGIPFVASNVGGIPEISVDRTDILVPPGDPAALANALEKIINQDQSIRPPQRCITWEQSAADLIDLLQPLLHAKELELSV